MKKRILFLLLAALILMTGAACNNSENAQTENGVTTASPTPETEPEALTDGLEDINMDGYEFNILASQLSWTKGVFVTVNDGEPINDAHYKRNLYLEERFKCKISSVEDPSITHGEAAQKAIADINSDSGEYDLVTLYDIYITSMLPYIADWNNVPYLSLDQVWWNPDASEVYNWGGKQLAVNGYICLSAASNATSIMFNKDLLAVMNRDQAELYKAAKEGRWTLDMMLEYGKAAVQDINGDSVMDGEDQYGFFGGQGPKGYVNAAMASADVRYIGYDEQHYPVYNFDSEKNINALQTLIDKTFASGAYYSEATNPDQALPADFFQTGRVLFMQGAISSIEQYRMVDQFEIGILPFPKFDGTQDQYRSFIVGCVAGFLPRTVSPDDYEKIGTLLEAMAFYTYHDILPVYKEISLKTKSARDNESADMLDIIFDTVTFDMGHCLESLITKPLISATFMKQDSGNIVSNVEKDKTKIQETLEELIELAEKVE